MKQLNSTLIKTLHELGTLFVVHTILSAWSSYTRYQIGNHGNDCLLDKLHGIAFISVVYFNVEKMLLYWSVDQYNNVQKFVERKGGAKGAMLPDGRKELILRQNHPTKLQFQETLRHWMGNPRKAVFKRKLER